MFASLPAVRIWPFANRELGPSPRTLVCWPHDLGLLASRNVRNRFLLLKLPGLWSCYSRPDWWRYKYNTKSFFLNQWKVTCQCSEPSFLGLFPPNKDILLCNHNFKKKKANQEINIITSLPRNPQTLFEFHLHGLIKNQYCYYCLDNIFNSIRVHFRNHKVISQVSSVSFSLESSSVLPWLPGPWCISRVFGRMSLNLVSQAFPYE